MDNLAHALVGAAMGRALADRRLPAPEIVGALAANAPDWSELFVGLPADLPTYLVRHRGITHALSGAVVEIVALTVLTQLAARWLARRRGGSAPGWGRTSVFMACAVLSHLYMDWQGSYGLRPWLPWSDRWSYGDIVAIVDPFFWLVPLVALAWGAHRDWRRALGYGAPPVLLVALLMPTGMAAWVKLVLLLLVIVGAVGWVGHWFGVVGRARAAAWALALLAGYAGAQAAASVAPRLRARADATARFGPGASWAVLTVPGRPFEWRALYADADTVAGTNWSLPRQLGSPLVRRVLRTTRRGRAMAQFARFLTAEVDTTPQGLRVVLRDVRYERTADSGWGVLVVTVPPN